MKIRNIMVVVCAALLISCSGSNSGSDSGGGDGGGDNDKNLFSLWHEVKTGDPLDLRDANFNDILYMSWYFNNGAECLCDFTLIGTQQSGDYIQNSCIYIVDSGPEDPGCYLLNETGDYTNSDGRLHIDGTNGISNYE